MQALSGVRGLSSGWRSAVALAVSATSVLTLGQVSAQADAVIGTITVDDGPSGIVFTPSGTRAYVTNEGEGSVSVVDTATNAVVATVPIVSPSQAAVLPDGSRVYVADSFGGVWCIDTTTNTLVGAAVAAGASVTGIAVAPSGAVAYLALANGNVAVLDTATNVLVDQDPVAAGVNPIAVGGSLGGIVVRPDGKFYVAVANSGHVDLVDPATRTVLNYIFTDAGGDTLRITPDGFRVYATGNSTVTVIDTATNTVIDVNPDAGLVGIPVGSVPVGGAVTPDGAELHVADPASDTVFVIATASNTVTATYPVGDEPVALAVRPDGAVVYVANAASGTVSVVSTSANPAVLVAQAPPGTATQGKPYSYTFTASGPPAPTFAVDSGSLPAGLTLNPTSGVLSGTPTAIGSSTFTVSATNFAGTDTTGPLGITVNAAPPAPVVGSCAGLKATRTGTNGKDVIRGTAGRDVIDGRGGNDVIRGLGGNDVICGGDGNDRIIGGGSADKLYGGRGNDSISGNAGKDRLEGGAGRDELYGGAGKDTLKGGAGRDRVQQS